MVAWEIVKPMSKVIVPLDFLWEQRVLAMYLGFKEEGDWQGMETVKAMLRHLGLTVEGIEN